MSARNKIHEYKGYKFNIKVELDYQVERSLDGKREHKITLSDVKNDYHVSKLTETSNLKTRLQCLIEEAELWADIHEKNKTEEEKILDELGFN